MVITRVVPLSAAKITATLYAIIGLIIGACFSLISVVTTVATGPLLALVRRFVPERAGGSAHRSPAAASPPRTARRRNEA